MNDNRDTQKMRLGDAAIDKGWTFAVIILSGKHHKTVGYEPAPSVKGSMSFLTSRGASHRPGGRWLCDQLA